MSTTSSQAHGTEAEVCADISRRQQAGMNKYGVSVADNPLTEGQWLEHAYEEALDLAVYLKRILTTTRHFDAAEAVAEPEFRYFKDADGDRYKMPVNGLPGYKLYPDSSAWLDCDVSLGEMMHPANVKHDGTIETDADGNPLVDTSVGIPINPEKTGPRLFKKAEFGEWPAKAREWSLQVLESGMVAPFGPDLLPTEKSVHVREVMPGEADLLAEAVGHLKSILAADSADIATPLQWADDWISKKFPEPAPEPSEFDKWYANWAGVFANKEQASAMFREAQRPTS